MTNRMNVFLTIFYLLIITGCPLAAVESTSIAGGTQASDESEAGVIKRVDKASSDLGQPNQEPSPLPLTNIAGRTQSQDAPNVGVIKIVDKASPKVVIAEKPVNSTDPIAEKRQWKPVYPVKEQPDRILRGQARESVVDFQEIRPSMDARPEVETADLSEIRLPLESNREKAQEVRHSDKEDEHHEQTQDQGHE